MRQRGVPATLMRGGTSRALFLRAEDLPADRQRRDAVLLAAMGSPDERQIDGVGGAHPLTSKVAVLSPPTHEAADIDYLFLQVPVDTDTVSDTQNCGNILAGVGPWAIEHGVVEAADGTTEVAIHMVNTGSVAVATVNTPDGVVDYEGQAHIDGVPGTAAPVPLDFLDIAGANCGALLPTGRAIDSVDGLDVTCIDNGMPVVLMRATDLGVSGGESPAELEANGALKQRIEALRQRIGPRMNLGDVVDKTVPKMCLIAAARRGGALSTRTFIPHRVHESIGVLGAVSVATACVMPGTVAEGIAAVALAGRDGQVGRDADAIEVQVEHPTGAFTVALEFDGEGAVTRSALLRTARKLFQGKVYVPAHLYESPSGPSEP